VVFYALKGLLRRAFTTLFERSDCCAFGGMPDFALPTLFFYRLQFAPHIINPMGSNYRGLTFAICASLTVACSDDASVVPSSGGPAAAPTTSPTVSATVPLPSGTDAGTVASDAGLDGGNTDSAVPKSTVPTFVAIGYEGRSIASCDDGQTWTGNRSDDEKVKCFEPTDCDHDGKAGRGIAFGQGWFVANYGWGMPGNIRRSRDGFTWETVDTGSNFASMMFGNGLFIAASRISKVSIDGKTWTNAAVADIKFNGDTVWNFRRGAFVGTGFLMFGDGPSAVFSVDGKSWTQRSIPATCGVGQWEGGIAYGNGSIVTVAPNGAVCRSVDDGATWTGGMILARTDSRLLFSGTEFVTWGGGKMFRSKDGTNWSSTPLVKRVGGVPSAGDPSIGPVARSAGGTFVAISGGWGDWYEKQRFYRSADGVTWDELDASRYTKGHPMTSIVWGESLQNACKK
jgi:hypothetical protein